MSASVWLGTASTPVLLAADTGVLVAVLTVFAAALTTLGAYFEVHARMLDRRKARDAGPDIPERPRKDSPQAWEPSVVVPVGPSSELPPAEAGVSWWNRTDVVTANRWVTTSPLVGHVEPSTQPLPEPAVATGWWKQPGLRDAEVGSAGTDAPQALPS